MQAHATRRQAIRRSGDGVGTLGGSRGPGAGRTGGTRTSREREGVGATGSPTTHPERRDTPTRTYADVEPWTTDPPVFSALLQDRFRPRADIWSASALSLRPQYDVSACAIVSALQCLS